MTTGSVLTLLSLNIPIISLKGVVKLTLHRSLNVPISSFRTGISNKFTTL